MFAQNFPSFTIPVSLLILLLLGSFLIGLAIKKRRTKKLRYELKGIRQTLAADHELILQIREDLAKLSADKAKLAVLQLKQEEILERWRSLDESVRAIRG